MYKKKADSQDLTQSSYFTYYLIVLWFKWFASYIFVLLLLLPVSPSLSWGSSTSSVLWYESNLVMIILNHWCVSLTLDYCSSQRVDQSFFPLVTVIIECQSLSFICGKNKKGKTFTYLWRFHYFVHMLTTLRTGPDRNHLPRLVKSGLNYLRGQSLFKTQYHNCDSFSVFMKMQ